MQTKVTYYGVRGSIPTSGAKFDKYGGNTTCLTIQIGNQRLIIDAGTGIRKLGQEIMNESFSETNKLRIIFSHTHWDHLQGFPFFTPAYIPTNHIEFYGESKNFEMMDEKGNKFLDTWSIERTLQLQQSFMYFPVDTHNMASQKTYFNLAGEKEYQLGPFKFKTINLHHPNNTIGFRFEFDHGSFCFCTDVEHTPEMIERLITFTKGADVLAYDCQYTPSQYEAKKGWGHSTYEIGARIVKEAGVTELHMIHHDPEHDDAMLDLMEGAARKHYHNTTAIKEGQSIVF